MRRWAFLALVLLTIGCRLAYVVPIRLDMAEHPIRSAEVELSAISLLENGELGNVYHDPTGPTAHVSPVYPLVVAAIYAVFGVNTLAAMLVQSFLAAATIAATLCCLPWLARRCGLHEAAGWLAAFTLAVLPINYFYESFGDWEQPLAALVLIGLLACFLELRQTGWQRPRLVGALGLLSGVAALLSPSLMPAIALMLLVEFVWPTAPRRRVFAGAVCVVTLTAVLVAPWLIRNYYLLGGFVPLRSNFGMELSFGNHPESTGSSNVDWSDPDMSSKMRHPHPNAAECRKLAEMGEIAYMRQRQAEAIDWIRANPERFAELTVQRFRMFWFPGREMFNNASLSTQIKIAGFGAISALMFLGLFRLAWTRNGSFGLIAAALFGATFIYMITHVELRYRLPIHALSGLLAAEVVVIAALWLLRLVRRQGVSGEVRDRLRNEEPAAKRQATTGYSS
jgi:hypothetical protein